MNHFGLVYFNHLKRWTEAKNYRFLNQQCKIRTQEQKIRFMYDINILEIILSILTCCNKSS